MELIQPYARLMDVHNEGDGVRLLKKIEWAARISHRSEETQSEVSYERFLRAVVIGKGDWSVVEHAHASVDATVDRGVTHEWVRHRIGAYTQESTRFINYEKKIPPAFIMPQGMTLHEQPNWLDAIGAAEDAYRKLIQQGHAPQIARSVLPNALASRIVVTYNLRNWRHFLLMRTTRETHPQFREVTIPLLAEFKAKIPLLYDDIEPMATQADNVRKAR